MCLSNLSVSKCERLSQKSVILTAMGLLFLGTMAWAGQSAHQGSELKIGDGWVLGTVGSGGGGGNDNDTGNGGGGGGGGGDPIGNGGGQVGITPVHGSGGKLEHSLVFLDTEGSLVWSVAVNGSLVGQTLFSTMDDDGGLIVAGIFSGYLGLGGFHLAGEGGDDLFVARLDPEDGTVGWLEQVSSSGDEAIRALQAAPGGGVYLSAVFRHFEAFSLIDEGRYFERAFLIHLDIYGNLTRVEIHQQER